MLKKFLAICAAFVAIYFLISVPTVQKKFLYPFPYRSTVESYSSRWKVDKFLTIAVMKVESNFSEAAHSQSGAVGLMQIMPETAAWIAYQLGEAPEEAAQDIKNLRNPETNIRYGTWYLADRAPCQHKAESPGSLAGPLRGGQLGEPSAGLLEDGE